MSSKLQLGVFGNDCVLENKCYSYYWNYSVISLYIYSNSARTAALKVAVSCMPVVTWLFSGWEKGWWMRLFCCGLSWDSGLLLTFDIPEGDQVSPFSSVIRLTWRRLLRWSADVCSELCNSLNLDFCKVLLQLCDGTLIHDICTSGGGGGGGWWWWCSIRNSPSANSFRTALKTFLFATNVWLYIYLLRAPYLLVSVCTAPLNRSSYYDILEIVVKLLLLLLLFLGLSVCYKTDYAARPLLEIGRYGRAPGEFNEPSGITKDDDGVILMADSRNNRIQVFTNIMTMFNFTK